MDFRFTSEQERFRDEVRGFVKRVQHYSAAVRIVGLDRLRVILVEV